MKKLILPALLILALGADTQPATQPTTQPKPPRQLTTLISSDVLKLTSATDATRPKMIEDMIADLKGSKVYGTIVVDSVQDAGDHTVILGHLPWKQKAVLTADEQAKIDDAQKRYDEAEKTYLAGKAAAASNSGNGSAGQFRDAAIKKSKEATRASDKLKAVQSQVNAEAAAAVPAQHLTLSTTDKAATLLRTGNNYTLSGSIQDTNVTSQPPYVAFTIRVLGK